MSQPSPEGQALATAGRDADASFSDAPVDVHTDPCPQAADLMEVFFDDPFRGPCRDVLVQVVYASGAKESLRTDFRGAIRVKKTRGNVADISYRRDGETQKRRVFLRPETTSGTQAAWQRLVNMGYVFEPKPPPSPEPRKLTRAVQAFQADFHLEITGTLDEATRQRVEKEHGDRTPWENREWPMPPEPGPNDENLKGSLM